MSLVFMRTFDCAMSNIVKTAVAAFCLNVAFNHSRHREVKRSFKLQIQEFTFSVFAALVLAELTQPLVKSTKVKKLQLTPKAKCVAS